jgi:hypothetical protein
VLDWYPQLPTGHSCDLNDNDIAAFEAAQAKGDYELAESIRGGIYDRISRCLGQIGTHCGITHGYERQIVPSQEVVVDLAAHNQRVTERTQMGFK